MRIIIVEDEPVTRLDMKFMLEEAGYEVVGEGKDGFDAINLCKTYHPDMVIMDINMPNLNGISAAKIIRKDKLCKAVVIMTAYSDIAYVQGAKEVGVFGYLVKPLDEKSLVPALEIAYAKALETEEIEQKLEMVSEKLEERKVIEKAKGHLMQTEGIDEETAYKRLRAISMEKRCSLRMISEVLLQSSNKNDRIKK